MIELGDLTSADALPPGPDPAVNPRMVRRILVAAIAVLALLVLTGSLAPQPPAVQPLWATPWADGDVPTFTDTTLYLSRKAGDDATLTAYDLASGRVKWSTAAGGTVTYFAPPADGVLVMPVEEGDAGIAQGDGTFVHSTLARDAATGRQLWKQEGEALYSSAQTVLLSETDGRGRMDGLRMVGLHDGVTRWYRAVSAVDSWGFDAIAPATPSAIVLADRVGDLTVLGYADGSVRRTGLVRWWGPSAQDGEAFTTIEAVRGLLVISRGTNAVPTVTTVYRLDTLRELWHADGFWLDCGALFCTGTSEGNPELIAHDPATGAVRWRVSGPSDAQLVGDRILAAPPGGNGRQQLLDAATGRPIGAPVVGAATWSVRSGRTVLVLTPADNDERRNPIVQIDTETGASHLLGTVDSVGSFGCQGEPRYLVCWRPNVLLVTGVRPDDLG